MGWRIGIDEKKHTEVISYGLFRLSRNPIFLAMRVNLLGILLISPHSVTHALLIAGDLLKPLQVRLDEVPLLSLHGANYAAYEQKSPALVVARKRRYR